MSVSGTEFDRYLAGLARALRGPRRAKADLLAEARHGLLDAAEAHRARGLPAHAAQLQAIAEFGGYPDVVPAYQAELAVAQGRRTAVLLAAGLVGLPATAPLIWGYRPEPATAPGPGYAWLATGFNWLCLAGALLALAVWLGLRWGSRYVPDSVALTRTLGRTALAFLALHGLAGLAVYLPRLALWPGVADRPPVWFGAAAMALAFSYAALCAWRCLAVTRPLGGGGALLRQA